MVSNVQETYQEPLSGSAKKEVREKGERKWMQSNNDEDDADEVFLRMRADTHWKGRVIRKQVAV